MTRLKAALSAYDAQYGINSLAEQHKCLGPGHIQRIEGVVNRAEEAHRILEEVRAIAAQVVIDIYDGDAASDILDLIAEV